MATIAMVVASGFEQGEMAILCRALAADGHRLVVVSPKKHAVRSWDNTHWGGDIPVDVAAIDAEAKNFAAVILPGGLIGADTLRADEPIIGLVRNAALQGKPVAALGHAVWVLIEAGLAKGRTMTSAPAIRSDVVHAGGSWQDSAVVEDGKVVTGRHGHDVVTFAELVRTVVGK